MPEGPEEAFVNALKASRQGLIKEAMATQPKRVSVLAKRDSIMELAEALRDDFGFTHPVSAGAIDWPEEERMQIIYYLMNPSSRFMLMLRVDLPRDDPSLPSLTQVWEGMSFHERETREMFGIEFEGHPNPRRLLLPPDWRGGFPLRKDFKAEGAQG